MAELLAGSADGRRVDQRQEFFQMFGNQRVIERFIGVLQVAQKDMAFQRRVVGADALDAAGHLVSQGIHARRQQAVKPERVALGGRKGRAFV